MQKDNYKIISINQKYMLAACLRTSDYPNHGYTDWSVMFINSLYQYLLKNDGQKQN